MLLFLIIHFLLLQTLGTWSPALVSNCMAVGSLRAEKAPVLVHPKTVDEAKASWPPTATNCAKGFTWRCPWTSQHTAHRERALRRGVHQKVWNPGARRGPEANDTPRRPCPVGARFLASSRGVHQSQVNGPMLWTTPLHPVRQSGSIPSYRGLGHFQTTINTSCFFSKINWTTEKKSLEKSLLPSLLMAFSNLKPSFRNFCGL